MNIGPRIIRDGLVLNLDAGQITSLNGNSINWKDLSGYRNDAILNTNLAFNSLNGGSVVFDGISTLGTIGSKSILASVNITIAAFVKTVNDSQSVQYVGGYGNASNQGYWLGCFGDNIKSWVFSVGNGVSGRQLQTDNNLLVQNNIIYVVGTFNGQYQKIYLNGVLKNNSGIVSGNLSYSAALTDGFLIGNIQGIDSTRFFSGNIYNMQIYNRELSNSEILQNYNTIKNRFGL